MQQCFSHWLCLHFPAWSIELMMSEFFLYHFFLTEGKFYKYYNAMDQTSVMKTTKVPYFSVVTIWSEARRRRDSWLSTLHRRHVYVTVRRTYLLLLFHHPFLLLDVRALHSSALCTSYSSRSLPGLSAPPPPPLPPPSLVCLCLSLPSAAVTRFKVTSSHRLLGSPSVLTYFYWLMHCSPHKKKHTHTEQMGTNTQTHIG